MKQICRLLAMMVLLLIATNNMAETTSTNGSPSSVKASRLWNLQDADILSVINEVSLETGKNFVVDPRVTGKISLISSKPIKPREVYQLFLSILELLGYSAIPSGNVIKIIPNIESGEHATAVATNRSPGKGDEVVVRVIPLDNISANQLIPILRPLLPQWSNISAYMPGNVLIILGRAANLQRIVDVIHDVDRASNNQIDIVSLHQASALQVATVLTNLQNASRASGDVPQVSVAADERSNSILLSGNKMARLHMRILISQMDEPSKAAQGNTEVVYLHYLQAKTFAPILGKIAQNMLNRDGSSSWQNASPPTYGINPGAPPAPSARSTSENVTNIQAEPNTNSLIIMAPPGLMNALKDVIAKLDIRPAQVLVEAVIVEIDASDLTNFGIQWGSNASTNQINLNASQGFPALGMGTVGIIPGYNIKALLSVIRNITSANILSTPNIVVLDNQKASLAVGQEVPEQTGSYATTGSSSTVTPFTTIANKPVELKLDVTPQINLGNAVRLTIALKNDSLQNPSNPGLTPITNTSEIKNSVIINSDDMLVLGGLISNNISDGVDEVPFLSALPIVGEAFKYKTRTLQKKSLMVFIKPTILHDANDSLAVTNSKYTVIRNAQINWPEDLSSKGKQKLLNVLPPLKNNADLPKPFED